MLTVKRFLLIVALVFMLVGSTACLASCFPNSEGGFLDYFTGSSLTRDKAAWEAERQRLAELARKEEARADQLRSELAIAQEKTQQLELEEDIAEAEARALDLQVQLKLAEGEVMVDRSVAQTLTMTSRMHAVKDFVLIGFALFGFGIAAGLVADMVLFKVRGRGLLPDRSRSL